LRYLFENYAFDTDRRELHRGADLVPLAPQVFDLLDYLIRNRERVVSKDDLISAIWNGRVVSDAALTTRLNIARSAIGDSGEDQRLIKTLPRKGFRFVGPGQQTHVPSGAEVADKPEESPKPALALPDKPSIAILPFINLSSDPDQDYFADGMVEDIISGLSRSKSLFVIARNSSFTYKGKAVDIKQVGRELGVRYVLEGSVRKAGNHVRISGQLIDAESGAHVWADKFDDRLEDIFDLQDRLTSSVIGAISPQLMRAEFERVRRKPTESLQAYDYFLQALACLYKETREGNTEALKLTQIANSVDPELALSYALGAFIYTQRKGNQLVTEPEHEISETRRLARRALELDKDDPTVLTNAGWGLAFVVGELEEGAALLLRAISLDPNNVAARIWSGWTQIYVGNLEATIEHCHAALRLTPLNPHTFLARQGIAFAHFLAGRYDESLVWATKAMRLQPNFIGIYRIAMGCHVMSGRIEEARQVCAHVMLMNPNQRVSALKDLHPRLKPEHLKRMEDAYRIAGMPE
jgi:TolB-like protein/Tfp pilus assembly protein PilF